MSTIWTYPKTVIQYAEDESHVSWSTETFEPVIKMIGGVSLSKPLLHIARQPKNDIKMKTWYVKATNFNFQNLPEVINGIKFRFTVDRVGRVFDETIQLTVNDEPVGENKCSQSVDAVQTYGGENDVWEVENLSNIINDPSFGIVVRLKSHPHWPHKSTPILRSLELQIF